MYVYFFASRVSHWQSGEIIMTIRTLVQWSDDIAIKKLSKQFECYCLYIKYLITEPEIKIARNNFYNMLHLHNVNIFSITSL